MQGEYSREKVQGLINKARTIQEVEGKSELFAVPLDNAIVRELERENIFISNSNTNDWALNLELALEIHSLGIESEIAHTFMEKVMKNDLYAGVNHGLTPKQFESLRREVGRQMQMRASAMHAEHHWSDAVSSLLGQRMAAAQTRDGEMGKPSRGGRQGNKPSGGVPRVEP